MPSPSIVACIVSSLALIVSGISAFIRTDGHGWISRLVIEIDSASDPDQEYIYFVLSETLPSAVGNVSFTACKV